jgi:GR25 family glycosyltransferase involved in LPS biosynthesis
MQTEFVDGVFYINLDKRTDRRVAVEAEFEKIGIEAERFVGIERKPGIVGCGQSHLSVLRLAKERDYKNVLIFEDDFEFLVVRDEFWSRLEQFFADEIPYDVLMLSYLMHESEPYNDYLLKVNYASTASAYIVHNSFYDSIIELYETNLPLLESTGKHWLYANDQVWKSLQPISRWYAFTPRLGRQRASYSDNSLTFQNYGV